MRKFGLIGYSLGHSFSKKYFAEKFISEQITDCLYDNYPLEDITFLPELIKRESELCGLNVTIPHKSAVMRFLDVIDDEAYEIGAVNVVKIKREGREIRLFGYNSDVTGIRVTLFPLVKEIRSAIVLGTGGSSRAVCHVLTKAGINITLISRHKKPGILDYSEITPGLIEKSRLIINTTPLGMFPDTVSKPELNYDILDHNHILFDLVYNPELTAFLMEGKERGCTIISGLKMLHAQAERAWQIWNDETS